MKQFSYSHREQCYSLCVSRIKRLDHIGNIAFQTGPPRVSVCMKVCSCCSLCVHLNRFTRGVRESKPNRGHPTNTWGQLAFIARLHVMHGATAQASGVKRSKLKGELPGILKWATDGCIEWQRNGLQPPEVVVSATSEYRREMDSLADFIETCTRAGGDVQATPLYQRYKDWAEDNGYKPLNQTNFGLRLAERGIKKDKRGVVKYIGIQLATECPQCAGEGCRWCQ